MEKNVHTVNICPIENGEPNMEIIRGERDFDSKASALKFVSQYNQYVSMSTRCKAVYIGKFKENMPNLG